MQRMGKLEKRFGPFRIENTRCDFLDRKNNGDTDKRSKQREGAVVPELVQDG
jgi:hypothetical protein